MDRKILLATDTSEFSSGAEREAMKYAKAAGARLCCMSVVEINPELLSLAPGAFEKTEKDTQKHLENLCKAAAKVSVKCETAVREGEPYISIIEEAEKRRSDLIIMGRRGKAGLLRTLMGSETAKVIGHYNGSVMIVPRKAQVRWKNILVATDGSEYGNAAVNKAIQYAKKYGSSLKVVGAVNVMPDFQEQAFSVYPSLIEAVKNQVKKNLGQIKKRATRQGIKTTTYVIEDEPYRAIIDIAKKSKADIIFLGSHGRTGIQRLLMGSVTERVVGHADCAVMVVKP